MASNYQSTPGLMRFASISDQSHADSINRNVVAIVDVSPSFLNIIIRPLASLVMSYILNIDDNYTLNVADEQLSDPESYSILRTIGSRIEEFRNSNLASYFNTSEQTFVKNIWTPRDLSKYVDDIIEFCAAAQAGHINTTALKNILSLFLREEISQERATVNSTEIIVVYSTRNSQCGVMKLTFIGERLEITECCSTGQKITLCVKKVVIMFMNTRDLLYTLRTFVQANR
jgi:hypothetical protein